MKAGRKSGRHATRVSQQKQAESNGFFISAGRVIFRVMAVGVIGVGIYGLYLGGGEVVRRVNEQTVRLVRIEGELINVSEQEVQQLMSAYAGQSFLSLDLEQLKQDLRSAPWIREVSVKREWPDVLIIQVDEHRAIARWNNTDLLNQFGQRFTPEEVHDYQNLPLLEGPDEHEERVMQQYQKFSQQLLPHGLRLRSLALSARGGWQTVLDNGLLVKIGKDDVADRLQRFTVVINQGLLGDESGAVSVDLRYQNGLAVEYRPGEETMLSSL